MNTDSLQIRYSDLMRYYARIATSCFETVHRIRQTALKGIVIEEERSQQVLSAPTGISRLNKGEARAYRNAVWNRNALRRRFSNKMFFDYPEDDLFANFLIRAYPRDGAKVRESLRRIGWSDVDMVLAFRRNVGRSKQTAYLFSGLPSDKDVERIQEQERKKQIEKQMKAWKAEQERLAQLKKIEEEIKRKKARAAEEEKKREK